MNVLRTVRSFVLFGSIVALALGTIATPAQAGGSGHDSHGCYKSSSCYYPQRCNYNYCRPTNCYPTCYPSYYPTCYPCLKPVCYPVAIYDCFGQPHIVYQTSGAPFLR